MKSRIAFMIIVFILCMSMITGKSTSRKNKLKKKSTSLVSLVTYKAQSKTNSTLLVAKPNLFKKLGKGIKKVGKRIKKKTKKIGKKIVKGAKKARKTVKKRIKKIKKPIKKIAKKSLLGRAVHRVGGAIKRTARKVKKGIKKVGKKIKNIGRKIKKKAHKVVKRIKKKVSKKKKKLLKGKKFKKKNKLYRKNKSKKYKGKIKKMKKYKSKKLKKSSKYKKNKKMYRKNYNNQCTSSFLNNTQSSYSNIVDRIYAKGKTLINPKHSNSFAQCIENLRNQEHKYKKVIYNFNKRYRKKLSDKSASKLIKKVLNSIETTYSSILDTETVSCRKIEFNLLKTKPKLTKLTTEEKPSPMFMDGLYSTHRNMLSDKDFAFLNQH